MDTDDATLSKAAVSARLRELRARERWSQKRLALAMRARGWAWHQETVSRVEAGERHAVFGEVETLAVIFGVPITTFQYGQAA